MESHKTVILLRDLQSAVVHTALEWQDPTCANWQPHDMGLGMCGNRNDSAESNADVLG